MRRAPPKTPSLNFPGSNISEIHRRAENSSESRYRRRPVSLNSITAARYSIRRRQRCSGCSFRLLLPQIPTEISFLRTMHFFTSEKKRKKINIWFQYMWEPINTPPAPLFWALPPALPSVSGQWETETMLSGYWEVRVQPEQRMRLLMRALEPESHRRRRRYPPHPHTHTHRRYPPPQIKGLHGEGKARKKHVSILPPSTRGCSTPGGWGGSIRAGGDLGHVDLGDLLTQRCC